jgi:hypothetical protein
MQSHRPLFGTSLAALMMLAACGGTASIASSPAASAPPPASVAAKPSAAASAAASASAKPAASAAASAKPAASGASAKPAASGSAAPKPAPTTLPAVAADTTQVTLSKVAIPAIAGKTLSADISEIDQATNMLYVTDRTTNGVDIFDVSSFPGKFVKTIPVPGGGANGLTIAKNVNKILVGNNDSTVSIIDINPSSPTVNTVLATLSTGGKKRADETDYDPNTKKMMVANSDDAFVTTVDMVNNKIVKKIDVPGGAIEQPRYNPADKFMYMTGSEDNVYYQFDMTNDTMVKKTPIVDKCNPNGNAINPTLDIALLDCSNTAQPQHMAIWDIKAGKVTSTTDKTGTGDGAIYDAKTDKFYATAANFFRGGMMAIFDGKGSFITNVPTAVGSHGVAYDETNNALYTQDQMPNDGVMFAFKVPSGSGAGASAAAKPAAGGAASGGAAASGVAAAKPSAS